MHFYNSTRQHTFANFILSSGKKSSCKQRKIYFKVNCSYSRDWNIESLRLTTPPQTYSCKSCNFAMLSCSSSIKDKIQSSNQKTVAAKSAWNYAYMLPDLFQQILENLIKIHQSYFTYSCKKLWFKWENW